MDSVISPQLSSTGRKGATAERGWGGVGVGGSGFHPYPKGYTATPVRVAEDGLKVMKTNKLGCAFVFIRWKMVYLGPGRMGGSFARSGRRPGHLYE